MSAAAVMAGGARGGSRLLNPSFRGDAQHRTTMRYCASENLEIPGLVLAHHPGMTISASVRYQDNAGFTTGTGCFGPQRVSITLTHDSTPSNTMEAAASLKKS